MKCVWGRRRGNDGFLLLMLHDFPPVQSDFLKFSGGHFWHAVSEVSHVKDR